MTDLVFLIGMPGCGKTYWAQRWAKAHSWHFFDLDAAIEEKHSMTIRELFATLGEQFFRAEETAILQSLINTGTAHTIVAAGGGTPVFNQNIDLMLDSGCVVYIQAALPVLSERLEADLDSRPLFAGKDISETLVDMLHARRGIYEKASIIVDAESLSEATFAQIMEACTNRH